MLCLHSTVISLLHISVSMYVIVLSGKMFNCMCALSLAAFNQPLVVGYVV